MRNLLGARRGTADSPEDLRAEVERLRAVERNVVGEHKRVRAEAQAELVQLKQKLRVHAEEAAEQARELERAKQRLEKKEARLDRRLEEKRANGNLLGTLRRGVSVGGGSGVASATPELEAEPATPAAPVVPAPSKPLPRLRRRAAEPPAPTELPVDGETGLAERARELEIRERRLDELELQHEASATTIDRQAEAVTARQLELTRAQAAITRRENELDERDRKLEEAKGKIKRAVPELKARAAAVKERQATLAAAEASLAEREIELERTVREEERRRRETLTQIRLQETTLAERRRELAELGRALAAREAELGGRRRGRGRDAGATDWAPVQPASVESPPDNTTFRAGVRSLARRRAEAESWED